MVSRVSSDLLIPQKDRTNRTYLVTHNSGREKRTDFCVSVRQRTDKWAAIKVCFAPWVHLPARPGQNAARPNAKVNVSSVRILVVEDHEQIRQYVCSLLKREPQLDVIC